jgi:hypothetical protein
MVEVLLVQLSFNGQMEGEGLGATAVYLLPKSLNLERSTRIDCPISPRNVDPTLNDSSRSDSCPEYYMK